MGLLVGADRFRPHALAIEWDNMVATFKSGAAVVVFYSVTAEKIPFSATHIQRIENLFAKGAK